MNQSQTEAVAQADAELSNAVLPTYTQLLAGLRELHAWVEGASNPPHGLLDRADAILARAGA